MFDVIIKFLWSNVLIIIGLLVLIVLAWKLYAQSTGLKVVKADMGNLVQMISRIPRTAPPRRQQQAARRTQEPQAPPPPPDSIGLRSYHNPTASVGRGVAVRPPPGTASSSTKDDDETNTALTQWFQNGGVTRAR